MAIEVSAKTGDNIKQLFEEVARKKFNSKNTEDELNDLITTEPSSTKETNVKSHGKCC